MRSNSLFEILEDSKFQSQVINYHQTMKQIIPGRIWIRMHDLD